MKWFALLLIVLPLWAQKPAARMEHPAHRATIAPRTASSAPVILFNNQSATQAAVSLLTPNALNSGFGSLILSGAGISGSSVCTFNIFYASLTSGLVDTVPFATVPGFALSNNFQSFSINPIGGSANAAADAMVAAYSCTTYPISGTFSASFNTSLPTVINLPATGGMIPLVACDNRAIIAKSTSGSTQLVAASAGHSIYICGWTVNTAATTLVNVKLVSGTGTNCATSPTDISETIALQNPSGSAPVGAIIPDPVNAVDRLPMSQALCVNSSAGQQIYGKVWYAQF